MSNQEKRNAIPAEGTVTEAKPAEAKEGFFQKIGKKVRRIAAKPAVRRTAKIVGNVLIGTGLVGLGWVARDVAGNNDSDEDETVVLTEGDYEESKEETETEAEENE